MNFKKVGIKWFKDDKENVGINGGVRVFIFCTDPDYIFKWNINVM